MYIQRISALSIEVTGTGNTAVTTITLPSSFTPAAGCIYDIRISAQVPSETDGTIVAFSAGSGETATALGNLYQRNGNYARARALGWRKVLRVEFFDDPAHFNLLAVRS